MARRHALNWRPVVIPRSYLLAPGRHFGRLCAVCCLGLAAVGCQTTPPETALHADDEREPVAAATEVSPAMANLFPGWQPQPMPGKRWAAFVPVEQDGREGLEVAGQASLSILSKRMAERPHTGPAVLRFSWWVERDLPGARLADASASDSPARVAVSFAGDRGAFTARDHMLSELLSLMTGDPLPHATLVYVWANDLPPGATVASPRTQRVRYLAVDQGRQRLGQWVFHQRDVRADFERVFGEAPGPIVGLALMTDTDNTRTSARTVYGPVSLGAE
jgi:hypothetical protein